MASVGVVDASATASAEGVGLFFGVAVAFLLFFASGDVPSFWPFASFGSFFFFEFLSGWLFEGMKGGNFSPCPREMKAGVLGSGFELSIVA